MIKKNQLLILVLISTTSISQETHPMIQDHGSIGKMAFSGDTSLSEMFHSFPLENYMGKNDVIKVELRTTFVNNFEKISDSLGLPKIKHHGYTLKKTELYAPFEYSTYLKDNKNNDFLDFSLHIESILSGVTNQPQDLKNKRGTENTSNCAGFSLGTTFTFHFNSCILGSTTTELTCQTNHRTDGKDWFITSQSSTAPGNINDCINIEP